MAASARCSGTVLGVLLLGCVAAALPLLGIPGTTQSAIYGAVILIALLIDRLGAPAGIASLARGERMSTTKLPRRRLRARRAPRHARPGRFCWSGPRR